MTQTNKTKESMNLVEGPIVKTLILFAIPLIGSFLLQSLYSLVDMIIISRFAGTYSVAGVNVAAQISDLVLALIIGFLAGPTVIVAQMIGAGKEEKLKKTIATTFSIVFIMALIVMIIMHLLRNPILQLVKTPAECYGEASNYYLVSMSGIIFVFLYNTIASLLRGMGDSKNPLYFVMISTGINVVLDFIFIACFHMGAFGAALATVIAQASSVCFSIVYLRKHSFPFTFTPGEFCIDKEQLGSIFRLGTPSAIQNSFLNFSLVFLIAVANTLGVYESSTVGIGGKINVIFILPIIAVSNALGPMIGQNIGAQKMDRAMKALKTGLVITSVYGFIIFLLWCSVPDYIFRIFTKDSQVLALGASYLRGHCFDYLLVMPAAYCFGALYVATGHTSYVAVSNIVGALISRIPISYGLAILLHLGVRGIGLAYPISTAVTMICYLILFVMGGWKKSNV